jgi:hypothetical protein
MFERQRGGLDVENEGGHMKQFYWQTWCPRPELNWDQRFRKQFSLLHDGKQKTIVNIGHS